MNIKVDANIIKKTTKCGENFCCLSSETPIFSVELCIENILLNVSSNERMQSCIRIRVSELKKLKISKSW